MVIAEFKTASEFIVESFKTAKLRAAKTTYDSFAKQVGLGSSSLKMIVAGARRPTLSQVLSVARALRLSPSEVAHLEALCLNETAEGDWEKAYFSKKLKSTKAALKVRTVVTSKRELLSEPFVLPLLVYCLEQAESALDLDKLSKYLDVPVTKLEAAIRVFQSDETLRKQPDGKFHVSFDKMKNRNLQREYQKRVLAESSKRIDRQYDEPSATFVSYSFTASEESLQRLRQDLKELMEKYLSEPANPSKSVSVARACFQVYSVIPGGPSENLRS
jgi:uncharacterized protein (TIGR02147 family)